jgi:hypothetical protein
MEVRREGEAHGGQAPDRGAVRELGSREAPLVVLADCEEGSLAGSLADTGAGHAEARRDLAHVVAVGEDRRVPGGALGDRIRLRSAPLREVETAGAECLRLRLRQLPGGIVDSRPRAPQLTDGAGGDVRKPLLIDPGIAEDELQPAERRSRLGNHLARPFVTRTR